jgi:hypothetical protein
MIISISEANEFMYLFDRSPDHISNSSGRNVTSYYYGKDYAELYGVCVEMDKSRRVNETNITVKIYTERRISNVIRIKTKDQSILHIRVYQDENNENIYSGEFNANRVYIIAYKDQEFNGSTAISNNTYSEDITFMYIDFEGYGYYQKIYLKY